MTVHATGTTTGTTTGTKAKPTPSARRDEILAIAAAIFARKGILGTTVRDIADEAGILSGSLYHHFESKDQMVEEILHDHGQRQLQAFKDVVAREPDPVEAVHGLVIVGVQFVADNPDVARIFRNDVQQIKEIPRLAHVERNRQESRQIWNGVVRAGIDRRRVPGAARPRDRRAGHVRRRAGQLPLVPAARPLDPPADQRAALPAVRRRLEVAPTSFPNVHVRAGDRRVHDPRT